MVWKRTALAVQTRTSTEMVVAARYALEPSDRMEARLSCTAATIGLVIALFLIAGQHESVTATLTRWTLQ